MEQNFTQYFRALQTLFFALLAGQILVILVLYLVQEPNVSAFTGYQDLLLKAVPVVMVLLAVLAFFMQQKKLESAREKMDIKGKLSDYRALSVMKLALIEGTTLITGLLFFEFNNVVFIYYALVMIAVFASQFPSRQRLVNDLDLTATEQMTLDDPDAIVFTAPR